MQHNHYRGVSQNARRNVENGTLRGQKQWEGLRRSREQWQATPHPTSVVSFAYAR